MRKLALCLLAIETLWHLQQDKRNCLIVREDEMEKLKTNTGGKQKTSFIYILEPGNVIAINRHHKALSTIVNQIDRLKLQVV